MKLSTILLLLIADAACTWASPPVHGPQPLEERQAQVGPAAVLTNYAPRPTVTTLWYQTMVGGQLVEVSTVYTQLFSAVPDQLPLPGSGSIGYGTMAPNKRQAPPVETGLAGRVRV